MPGRGCRRSEQRDGGLRCLDPRFSPPWPGYGSSPPEDGGEGDTRSVEREAAQSPNTNSIDAVEVFLSSGASLSTAAGCFEPTSTAMYCLPLTE
jgi:hypothetical protein